MKYMGSKRMMLQNGLGDLLADEIGRSTRFVDLFAGSGAVAIHVARTFAVPVLAFDLQRYSVVLSEAVINRVTKVEWQRVWRDWHRRAESEIKKVRVPATPKLTQAIVRDYRVWCANQTCLPVTEAYGGHYFSPQQAVWIDALRSNLPKREPTKTVALAALIQSASQCAAAPGHTAQPFQPTRTAKPFLQEAWSKDVAQRTKNALALLADQFAKQRGKARVSDATEAAKQLNNGDLVFIDPPYSGVHYSRFYHVLETIACGHCGEVTGIGRYPARELRPRSKYSVKSESAVALDELLETIASNGARAILTFPDHDCSNGLSGKAVREIAGKHFFIREQPVNCSFSTLGGTGEENGKASRGARQEARELILVLQP